MADLENRHEKLVTEIVQYFENTADEVVSFKPLPHKWSKKEILGHLIDSAMVNLQRFSEIKYFSSPYKLKNYDQDKRVEIAGYHDQKAEDLIPIFKQLNHIINTIFIDFTEDELELSIVLPEGEEVNLKYWIQDYIDHMDHHKKQILSPVDT